MHCFEITLMKSKKNAILKSIVAKNIMVFVIFVVAYGLRLYASTQMLFQIALETQGRQLSSGVFFFFSCACAIYDHSFCKSV